MNKTATVRARIEPGIKAKAEKKLKKIGLSPSEAINVFYHQLAGECAFPFSLHVPNAETRKAIADARKGIGLKRMTIEEFAEEMRRVAREA